MVLITEKYEMSIETAEPMNTTDSRVEAQEHSESSVAKMIEEQTVKLPSELFLYAAGASMIGSLTLKMMGKEHSALFVGQWAAPFLILGLYNKIVKVTGSNRIQASRC